MSHRIGQLLINKGLITEEQLRKALDSQKMYGGRLGMNLIELGYVAESSIAQLLSEQFQVPFVGSDQLARAHPEALKLVNVDLARKLSIVPLKVTDTELAIAMVNPKDLKTIDEVAFSTGKKIAPVVAPELAIALALEHHYGIRRPARFTRTADDLDSAFGRSGAFTPPVGAIGGYTDVELPTGDVEVLNSSEIELLPSSADVPPLDMEGAVTKLAHVDTHADITNVLVQFACRYFPYVAVFAVRGEQVIAWEQRGGALSQEKLRQLKFPLSESRILAPTCKAGAPYAGLPPDHAFDQKLLKLLSFPLDSPVLCCAVRVEAEPVCAVLAAEPHSGRVEGHIDEVDDVARKAALAFQLLMIRQEILKRK